MVRIETNTHTISNLQARNRCDTTYEKGQHIMISSHFQRGDEETGVWRAKQKQSYIDSLMLGFPTGIMTYVKDHTLATSYQEPWNVLDGGNRLRAIRDFMRDKFQTIQGLKYSELGPQVTAEFNTILIPCQWLTIERSDPSDTIAEMFTRLNTSALALSQGELIKSHGWKSDIYEIEIAKQLVGGSWNTTVVIPDITEIRIRWCEVFGVIRESRRCDSLAMMVGYILSAKSGTFAHFDKRYNTHRNHLLPSNALPPADLKNITDKLNNFLDIMEIIHNDNNHRQKLFGPNPNGIPSQSKIAPIWKPICEGTLTAEQSGQMIQFYTNHATTVEVQDKYKQLLTQGGNSETTDSKIEAVYEYIYSFANSQL